MSIRIDALPPTVNPSREHEFPAMKDGLTVKLSVGQVLDLVIDSAPEALDTLNELAAALGDDENFASTVLAALTARLEKDQNLADLTDAAAARDNLGLSYADAEDKAAFRVNIGIPDAYWETKAIGELVALQDDLTGVSVPPTDNSAYRYIRLTASDAYNAGVLTGESVSGSAPLVTATAVIDLDGSPMDGGTVHLINTERRFLRAGSTGTAENDQLQDHSHRLRAANVGASGSGSIGRLINVPGDASSGDNTPDDRVGLVVNAWGGSAGPVRGGIETRPRNIGVTYYMRIK